MSAELRRRLHEVAGSPDRSPDIAAAKRRGEGLRRRRHLAVGTTAAVVLVAVVTAAASLAPGLPEAPFVGDTSPGHDAGPDDPALVATFCATLADLEAAPPPEEGGNSAAELTALLEVAPETLREDVTAVRDYHRDVYVEGDPDTDSFDALPPDLQAAIERIEAFHQAHC